MASDRSRVTGITSQARLVKETDAQVPTNGAVLAATITEPLTPGPHPGIVIVQGSEPGQRIDYGVWVGLYASLGLTVLTYDKRGNGASTGTYPGELPSDSNLGIYAADAATVLRFLASWPGVDPKRVGFHGGSQGGWTVPLAIGRHQAPAAFAILVSGPAVTVDQQGVWAAFSASSQVLPSASPEAMNAEVRATTSSGYVPSTVLATIRQPMLWANGAADRQVPTTVNAEILRNFHHSNWDIEILPGVRPRAFRESEWARAGRAESNQAGERPSRSDRGLARPDGWCSSLNQRQSRVRFGARCRRTRPNGFRPSSAWMNR